LNKTLRKLLKNVNNKKERDTHKNVKSVLTSVLRAYTAENLIIWAVF